MLYRKIKENQGNRIVPSVIQPISESRSGDILTENEQLSNPVRSQPVMPPPVVVSPAVLPPPAVSLPVLSPPVVPPPVPEQQIRAPPFPDPGQTVVTPPPVPDGDLDLNNLRASTSCSCQK